MNEVAVVIPSHRGIKSEYLRNVYDADIIIVDDSPEQDIYGYPLSDNKVILKRVDQNHFFPDISYQKKLWRRRTAGIRNFGIWWAYKQGYQYIITMDDDVVAPPNFIQEYKKILSSDDNMAYTAVTTSGWVNTLNSNTWFARGIPYEDRVNYNITFKAIKITAPSKVHMGLWSNVLDLNGMDKLAASQNKTNVPQRIANDGDLYTVRPNQYIPLCAMNVGARRESALSLMQIPMGWQPYGQYGVFRIEDIWGGLVYQMLDRSTHITWGRPVVEHLKHGNLTWEMWGEHYANLMAKQFELAIEFASDKIHNLDVSLAQKYILLGKRLKTIIGGYYSQFISEELAGSLEAWGEIFSD